MIASLLLFVAPALLFGNSPDSVKLVKDGKVHEGRVVFEGQDEIVLRSGSRDQRIPRADIAEIRSLERTLAPILDRDLRATDAATLQSLAAECDKAGLGAEARNLWLRTLLAEPANEAAAKGLDAERIKDELKVAFGKDQRKIGDLEKPQASWKDAYELESTHFALRTDLDLAFALDVALGLERFYKRFYETLGWPLELYVFDQSPEVHLYGRAEDFPVAPVPGDTIWFTPGENRLYVLANPKPTIAAVVQGLSRQMLFNSLRRSAGATATVPAWASIGIAEMFSKAAPTERFGPWGELAKPDTAAFALAAGAKVDFERVFNASLNDFTGDDKRVEMTACAYSLVHFLVYGKEGSMRAGLGRFLREGAKGKISLSALSSALEMPRKDIESAWRAHIEANAK